MILTKDGRKDNWRDRLKPWVNKRNQALNIRVITDVMTWHLLWHAFETGTLKDIHYLTGITVPPGKKDSHFDESVSHGEACRQARSQAPTFRNNLCLKKLQMEYLNRCVKKHWLVLNYEVLSLGCWGGSSTVENTNLIRKIFLTQTDEATASERTLAGHVYHLFDSFNQNLRNDNLVKVKLMAELMYWTELDLTWFSRVVFHWQSIGVGGTALILSIA